MDDRTRSGDERRGVGLDEVKELLRCAYCCGQLEAATTLRCGHSVCSIHVQLLDRPEEPEPESAPLARTSTSSRSSDVTAISETSASASLPSCPVDGCVPHIGTSNSDPGLLPLSSRVAYYPPPPPSTFSSGSTVSLASTTSASSSSSSSKPKLKKVTAPKPDILLNKVWQLINTWSMRVESARQRVARRHFGDDDEGNGDDGTSDDDDDDDDTPPAVTPAAGASPLSLAPQDISSGPAGRVKRRRLDEAGGRSSPDVSEALDDTSFMKNLSMELQCEICFSLLYEPVTTPCQHTFCAKCLSRTLDHSTLCPLCRQELPGYAYFHEQPSNRIIQSLLLKAFPRATADRKEGIEEEERSARLDTPIFVCQLSFPTLPTILHIFEPRYRLMIRRCSRSENASFGMIMPPRAHGGDTQYGTMLEIISIQMLPDGRSMVETRGTHRFRVLERGNLDGYMVARIETFEDCPPDVEAMIGTPQSVEEMMETCRSFYEQLRSGAAPWVVQQMSNTYGEMPDDPSAFTYWMAMLLPIDEVEKAKLLPIRSPRLRLKLLVHWIETLNSSWWFGQGCVIS